MKNVLIIQRMQFGYLTDYYKYVQCLQSTFKFTIICWDYGKQKLDIDGAKIIYLDLTDNVVYKNIYFIWKAIKEIQSKKYDAIFIKYFIGCSLIKVLTRKKVVLDIRTGSIKDLKRKRVLQDFLLKIESRVFNHVTVISEGLRKKLKINIDRSSILSLGGEIHSDGLKIFNDIHLLYIGTLYNRKIENTIYGLQKFFNDNPDMVTKVKYTIVGAGLGHELDNLKKLVIQLKLGGVVELVGAVPYNEVHPFFENANVGISFIPLTDYFQFQPPTKTYEYLQSGMPVLATRTHANEEIINNLNGILINDTIEDFATGLGKLLSNYSQYNSLQIRQLVSGNTWQQVSNKFRTIIEHVFFKH